MRSAALSVAFCLALTLVAGGQDRRTEYLDFLRSADQTVAAGMAAAASDRERGDLRTVQFLSQELRKQVAAGNWNRAAETKSRMTVALQRSGAVAADAPRRQAEQERLHKQRVLAAQERARKDREFQHQQLMNRLQGY
jgi:hypothetical protein